MCGTNFGIEGMGAISGTLTSKLDNSFIVNKHSLFLNSSSAAIHIRGLHSHNCPKTVCYWLQFGLHTGDYLRRQDNLCVFI